MVVPGREASNGEERGYESGVRTSSIYDGAAIGPVGPTFALVPAFGRERA